MAKDVENQSAAINLYKTHIIAIGSITETPDLIREQAISALHATHDR